MLQNAYLVAKIGADTAENDQHFAEILPIGRRVADRHHDDGAGTCHWSGGVSAATSSTSQDCGGYELLLDAERFVKNRAYEQSNEVRKQKSIKIRHHFAISCE